MIARRPFSSAAPVNKLREFRARLAPPGGREAGSWHPHTKEKTLRELRGHFRSQ